NTALNSQTAYALRDHQVHNGHVNGRLSASYVTGSHNAKVGMFFMRVFDQLSGEVNNELTYTFRNRVPVSLTEFAGPILSNDRLINIGLYGQDQWTLNRLTL